ncbi:MAG TPA: metallophosphoesterase, partial [Acidobacteriaceae bacterium]|nr:metallophosphoesterase [Acidobacteriaceae bacterium]
EPDSPTQAADYAQLQTACHARGSDSSWDVVKSSLQAAHTQQPAPLFVTVSGDLLTHNFDCRLKTLDPTATAESVSQFAMKTLGFLSLQMREIFHDVPVYVALGNNDSGCSNYHQTPGSAFLHGVDESVAANFTKPEDRNRAVKAFSDRGDYSVLLPKSMHRTRLVVLQDVFESPSYRRCEGKPDDKAAVAQIDWLREQLVSAKRDHQHVWVMAHISPGVDTYASFHKFTGSPEKLCTVTEPVMLLNSDALARTLTDFAGTVTLAIFAHTHMDEIKLLHNAEGASVAAKLVPSVSPINGNVPAFLVAEVQPTTAVMLDYAVFAASDATASSWSEEYRYSNAYRMPDFSADSVAQIASRFSKDKSGNDDLSMTYRRWFFAGDDGKFAQGLKTVWPAYACAVGEDGGPVFQECLCGAGAGTAAKPAAPVPSK